MASGVDLNVGGHYFQAKEDSDVSLPQVVAYNIQRARKSRGYSQHQLGERLESATGRTWSVALVSAAEAGWAGKSGRVRAFDINDLVAFGLALELPIIWFLMPPPTTPSEERVSVDHQWIRVSKEPRGLRLTSEQLSRMALSHSDPNDPDDLLGTRVRDEAANVVTPPSKVEPVEALYAELRKVIKKYEVSE